MLGWCELDSFASGQGQMVALENKVLIFFVPYNMGNSLTG
jgi:hypothetical protein